MTEFDIDLSAVLAKYPNAYDISVNILDEGDRRYLEMTMFANRLGHCTMTRISDRAKPDESMAMSLADAQALFFKARGISLCDGDKHAVA